MIVVLVLVVVVVAALVSWRRGRKARKTAGAALADTLGLVQPYKGQKWKVRTDRWL